MAATLHTFTGSSNGASPYGGVMTDTANNIYGTTYIGGNAGYGLVYELTPNGTYIVLHSFAGGSSDGANSWAGLITDNNGNFYGTTIYGGTSGYGTVFKLTANGTGGFNESIVYSFAGGTADGANPYAALSFDSTRTHLYGTTLNGGASGKGTVFKITL